MKKAMTIAITLASALALAGCDSNPLIGKWTCDAVNVEFTEKMATVGIMTIPVAYSKDGARYIATASDRPGSVIVEKDGNSLKMITPLKCEMVRSGSDE